MIILKSDRELGLMREAGLIVAEAHREVARAIQPGISTRELDEIVEAFIVRQGAVPSFKGFRGFPASICASINEEVVHGIPSLRRLNNGDIISIDIGAIANGFHGDAAVTYPVGDIDEESRRLLRVTEEALHLAIQKAVVGNRLSDISHAVQKHAEGHGLSVVRDYVGHGIGRTMHEPPQVPNYGPPGRGPRLKHGMTLALEPMVNMGSYEVVEKEDQWTVVTRDGRRSAHFEHTVAVTNDGPVILTRL
ncbi:MAG: type I methionyl aminopeptidase [Syntrophomonadaceae bacterium]|nr:type I methionyl aminopeptidase [Syntrophomonadaceae bacterium]